MIDTGNLEASGAARQLLQGIGNGHLQGDELRSVLENLPNVARDLAKGVMDAHVQSTKHCIEQMESVIEFLKTLQGTDDGDCA